MEAFLPTLDTKTFGGLKWKSETHFALWKQFVQQHNGKVVRVELPKLERTNTQNNYYWLYLDVIAKETGDYPQALHEFFKREFLPPRTIKVHINGKEIERKIPASTTSLSKIEFGEYLDRICALTNVPLPDPQAAGYLMK
jgi:hypothetical protein